MEPKSYISAIGGKVLLFAGIICVTVAIIMFVEGFLDHGDWDFMAFTYLSMGPLWIILSLTTKVKFDGGAWYFRPVKASDGSKLKKNRVEFGNDDLIRIDVLEKKKIQKNPQIAITYWNNGEEVTVKHEAKGVKSGELLKDLHDAYPEKIGETAMKRFEEEEIK